MNPKKKSDAWSNRIRYPDPSADLVGEGGGGRRRVDRHALVQVLYILTYVPTAKSTILIRFREQISPYQQLECFQKSLFEKIPINYQSSHLEYNNLF